MKTLTISIEKLKGPNQTGYVAVIKELGDSMIMADSIEEVFQQFPEVISACEKNNIGIFSKNLKIKK